MSLTAPRPLFLGLLLAGLAASAGAETLIGLTATNQLIRFDSAAPTDGSAPMSVLGLLANERLLAIDMRPSTGLVYGVSDMNRLYTLDATTGSASFVAALTTLGGSAYSLRSPAIGLDFNPVPDLGQVLPSLRLTSAAGENLRINVNGANAGVVTVDADLNGLPGVKVVASAYSNNDRDPATGTALYNIDASSGWLLQQTNPNGGTLVVKGPLGVPTIGVTGFDISATGAAYASLTDGDTGKSGLYRIDLNQGAATFLGAFGIRGDIAATPPIVGLTATAMAPAVPEPSTWALSTLGAAVAVVVARRRTRQGA